MQDTFCALYHGCAHRHAASEVFYGGCCSCCCVSQVLEELAISVQQNLISKLPFCAFNGGNDVFVDVGNKSIGLDALMRHLDCYPYEVGDFMCA